MRKDLGHCRRTESDLRAATTPNRFRLPAELVAKLEALAAAEGIGTEELAARLLVEVLPGMVAEKTERWLRTTLSLAYAIDVPGIREGRPDDEGVDAGLPDNERDPVAGMATATLPARRERIVPVTWRLPVGVSSILTYLVHQLRDYPDDSAAAEAALHRALDEVAP